MIEHPDLDRLLEKHLPKPNVRPAKDIVENLKAKVCIPRIKLFIYKSPVLHRKGEALYPMIALTTMYFSVFLCGIELRDST